MLGLNYLGFCVFYINVLTWIRCQMSDGFATLHHPAPCREARGHSLNKLEETKKIKAPSAIQQYIVDAQLGNSSGKVISNL